MAYIIVPRYLNFRKIYNLNKINDPQIGLILRYYLIYVFIISNIFAKDFYEGDSLVREGVYAFYDYEFDRSVSILSEAKDKYFNHPGVHMIWAASRWVQAKAVYSTKRSNQVLEKDLESIKATYKILIDKYEHDPNYRLYQGSAIGLSARLTLGKKQWLRTLYRAYLGFSIIDDIAENHPQIFDAHLPIGIIEYYSGISNNILKLAVRAYGLNPSVESGLNGIELSAEEGNWSWIEAKGILSYLYLWVEDDPILAHKHSKDLVENFPNNYYFNILYLESLIKMKKTNEIKDRIAHLDSTFKKLYPRQKEWYLPYLNYEKALNAFYQKDYVKVIDLLDKTINSYSSELDIILGNALLLKGMTFDMMNQRNEAKSNYIKCRKLDNLSLSMKKADRYLSIPYQGR